MSFCTNCGSQLTGEPKFCTFCGHPLIVAPPVQEVPAPVYEAPAYEAPAPVYEAPVPVYEAPTPVVEEAAPAYEAPTPVVEEAAPVVEEPAPVYEVPVPVYEAPAPVYEAPAPTYEAPAPVYEAPVPAYEAPAPAYEAPAPAYEAPAPVYEAPAPKYEAPAPVYEAPAPAYEAPAPAYEAPVPAYDAPAPAFEEPAPVVKKPSPKQHTPKFAKPAKKSKAGLIVGIAAILVVVVLAVLFLPKLLGGNPYIGKYDASSITFMGMTMSGKDLEMMGEAWFELKADDACTFMFAEEQVNGTWKMDGEKITCEIEGETLTGTIKDGKLELTVTVEGMEMGFVFEKTEEKQDETPKSDDVETVPTELSVDTLLPGYWTLLRADSADPANVLSVETVESMKEILGTEIFLNLKAGGAGEGSFYSDSRITWGDDKLTLVDLGIDCMYTLDGDHLTLIMDFDAGVKYIYVRGEGDPPEVELYDFSETETEPETEPEIEG